jgi:hypothetical protein
MSFCALEREDILVKSINSLLQFDCENKFFYLYLYQDNKDCKLDLAGTNRIFNKSNSERDRKREFFSSLLTYEESAWTGSVAQW